MQSERKEREGTSRRTLSTGVALLMSAMASLAFLVPVARPVHAQTFNWRNVNMQGMGFVTGVVANPNSPYDLFIRTDVGGAYRYDRTNNKWIPLMDQFGTSQDCYFGVESIAVDPTNTSRLWVAVRGVRDFGSTKPGEVLVSSDRGASWTTTGLLSQNVGVAPNGDWRGWSGERLTADPNKGDLLYFASIRNGLWKKAAGGSWSSVGGGLPAPSSLPGYVAPTYDGSGNVTNDGNLDDHPGFTFVAYDKTSSTSGNPCQTLYVGVYGSGVWRSTNGGANWSNINGAANPLRGVVASNGTLYVSFGSNDPGAAGSVRKYSGGTWTDITPLSSSNRNYLSYQQITVHPSTPNTIMVTRGTDKIIYRSTDGGANWSQVSLNVTGTPAFYPAPTAANYNTLPGGWGSTTLLIDPGDTNRVWQTNGYGVIKTDNITASPSTWAWTMNNLEELVVNGLKCPPVSGGADLLSYVHDMIGMRQVSRDVVPSSSYATINYVAQATSLDYSGLSPSYSAWVGFPQDGSTPTFTGFTSNNGQSWTPFSNTSPGQGGKIAMSATNPQNMVWGPAQWSKIVYTTNGGATWNKGQKPDYDADNGYDLPVAWHLSVKEWNGHVIAADRKENRFYYYAWGTLWYSTNGGANWTAGQNGYSLTPAMPVYTIKTNIVPNPAVARDLFISFCPNAGDPLNKLYRSTDGGVTFSVVSSVDSANFVAFGQGDSATVPYIYVHGRCNGDTQDAVYKSANNGASWTRITTPASQQFGLINGMEADMRVKDRVYLSTSGRGIILGEAGSNPVGAGYAVREVWNNVTGVVIANIPTGTTPSSSGNITSLEGPTNVADNYGDRIRGYITAPTSGSYTFWIAGDDYSDFNLSTDSNPANKTRIAYVEGWTNSREWGKYASQKSVTKNLVAGQQYYFEVLHKEGDGGDNVAVGWAKPGQSTTVPSEIVPGSQLSPYTTAPTDSARYNFESGVQGWAAFNASPLSATLSTSTTQKYAGSQSLAVALTATGSGSMLVGVTPTGLAAGNTITFRVWIPSGANLSSVNAFAQDGNWSWTGSSASLTPNQWNSVSLTVPSGAVTPINRIGIQFNTSAAWSGTIYIDSVNW